MWTPTRIVVAVCACFITASVIGCAEEEIDFELRDATTDADHDTDASDSELDGVLHDAVDDSSDSSDAEDAAGSDAIADGAATGDVPPDADSGSDGAEPCTMGVTPSEGGCPCETHLLQCCWGGLHIECVAPPGETYSAWIEVHDADWNCDEYPDCEDFEGVPPP